MILTNPVVIAVIVLLVMCFLRVNVLLALVIASVVAGLVSGMDIGTTIDTFITGCGTDPETAVAYVLLGGLAAAISYTGVSDILAVKIAKGISGKRLAFIFLIAFFSCFSQNLIPVHVAFIPILIPPLLIVMNKLKIDRRAVACALAFGLRAPYVTIPVGFGALYHGILSTNITQNGMPLGEMEVWKYTWPLGLAMLVGLIFAVLVLYRKPREYKDVEGVAVDLDTVDTTMTFKHWMALVGAVSTMVVQLATDSLPMGAVAGLAIMFITRAVKWSDMDQIVDEGVKLMGFIAFVMLASNGFSLVLSESGAAADLVESSLAFIGGNKFLGAFVMMLVGLVIVMGTGTSFGTVPVLAVLYVPLCDELGMGVAATTMLIAAASTIGDTGSPVSDTTLAPTAGLNADGQHDHIWDTCVPTFIASDIPIFILACLSPLFF